MIQVALYQPEIAQNVGNILRTGVCFNIKTHIIRPTGFVISDKLLKRANANYGTEYVLWDDFESFLFHTQSHNLRVLSMTASADKAICIPYYNMHYAHNDIIMAGPESCGLETSVIKKTSAAITIPMYKTDMSLNLATSVGIVLAEVMKQINWK